VWLHPGHLLEYGFEAVCTMGVLGIAWLIERRAKSEEIPS